MTPRQSSPAFAPTQSAPQPSDDAIYMRVYVGQARYFVTPDTLLKVLDQIRQDRRAA